MLLCGLTHCLTAFLEIMCQWWCIHLCGRIKLIFLDWYLLLILFLIDALKKKSYWYYPLLCSVPEASSYDLDLEMWRMRAAIKLALLTWLVLYCCLYRHLNWDPESEPFSFYFKLFIDACMEAFAPWQHVLFSDLVVVFSVWKRTSWLRLCYQVSTIFWPLNQLPS